MTGTISSEVGNSAAIDTNTGALYITGSAGTSLFGEAWAGADDIFLMKYDANGTRLWTRVVGTSGSDLGLGVSVDSINSMVYVTGQIASGIHGQSSAGGDDIITMKYSGNGTRVWTRMAGK